MADFISCIFEEIAEFFIDLWISKIGKKFKKKK